MVKVAWKVINGYGPYAYLQQSVKAGGKVTSKHLAYLGKAGAGGLVPGKHFVLAATADHPGGRLRVPFVGDETESALKPKPLAAVQYLEAQSKAGLPAKDIIAGLAKPGAASGAAAQKVAPNKSKTGPVQAAASVKTATSGAESPQVSQVPKDNQGKPLITQSNVKKLEQAAATGGLKALAAIADELAAKMLSPAKQAAIQNAAAELQGQLQGQPVQEGDGGSGLAETMEQVDNGQVKLPAQAVPSPKVVEQQRQAVKTGKKNYDASLEQVSGKKGSNEGGLFKDKHLNTLHYVKWPNSAARAKVEALTAQLYALAQVPVPTVRVVKFQGKDAVLSDWIDEAAPMSLYQMSQHPDVRSGFAADAWLANWDVVGLQADNVVKGPGNKAYRIDGGGSLLFRAQGKGKPLSAQVQELESLRSASVAPQASQVFQDLTAAELRESVKQVAAVTDQQIDEAVDRVKLPKKSADYPAAQFGAAASDLPTFLKYRLKERRDYLVDEVLRAEEKQQAGLDLLKQSVKLKLASLKAIAEKAGSYSHSQPNSTVKWALTQKVMRNELGSAQGKSASSETQSHYRGWKGSSNSGKGAKLRWAAGAMRGEGRRELERLAKFNDFLVKEKQMKQGEAEQFAKELQEAVATEQAGHLVDGLRLTQQQNEATFRLKDSGKDTVTVYRGWKAEQVKYLGAQQAKVGSTLKLDDPPLYSWTLNPSVANSFGGGHGSFVTRAEVPVDKVLLTDLVNSTGSFQSENEVLFKGLDNFKMEVTKTF